MAFSDLIPVVLGFKILFERFKSCFYCERSRAWETIKSKKEKKKKIGKFIKQEKESDEKEEMKSERIKIRKRIREL